MARLARSIRGVPRSTSTTPGLHRARDGDQGGAGLLGQPAGAEGLGSGSGDHGDVGQRLGVVHQRPAAPMRSARPLSGRKDGRDRPDRSSASADSSPATKRSGGRTRTSGTGAQPPPALGHGRERGGDVVAACGHAHGDPSRPACRGQQLRPVEHEVGRPQQEQLVLVAGGLALHGVDEDGAARAGGVRHGQLDRRREPGPPTARQPRGLEHRHERLAPPPGARAAAGTGPASPRGRPGRSDGRAAGSGRWPAWSRSRYARRAPARPRPLRARCFGGRRRPRRVPSSPRPGGRPPGAPRQRGADGGDARRRQAR